MSTALASDISVPTVHGPEAPVVATGLPSRISVSAEQLVAVAASGTIVVDIRDQRQRDTGGVLPGALALDESTLLSRLTPGGDASLRIATSAARWVLVSEDGHTAEWLAWQLQARGVHGAIFVAGGHRAIRRVRPVLAPSAQSRRDLEVLAAH
ncbi:rhodanese-like domain-containing protein [Williamsia sterculiae]|uniref:Rhodanese domain-containing protein n=1 Tax=Williamsia sterculiae TaxID=1344003 RepID=A0A1N7CRJ4_9NOCA|nr:hypothetical protein [Williamsia sterculiae]SIR66288.1 hypothetical protein SAMN05445060_0322 [Williamsia sterculiae]